MNQVLVKFTTDTGSPVTIISEQTFNKIGAAFTNAPIKHRITVANQTPAYILGYTNIQIQIENYSTCAEVIVLQNLNKDCLLGMDLLETCPLTKEPIKQLKIVLRAKKPPDKPKQAKKINKILRTIANITSARQKWIEVSDSPLREFVEHTTTITNNQDNRPQTCQKQAKELKIKYAT